jgi:hypothetical protein
MIESICAGCGGQLSAHAVKYCSPCTLFLCDQDEAKACETPDRVVAAGRREGECLFCGALVAGSQSECSRCAASSPLRYV